MLTCLIHNFLRVYRLKWKREWKLHVSINSRQCFFFCCYSISFSSFALLLMVCVLYFYVAVNVLRTQCVWSFNAFRRFINRNNETPSKLARLRTYRDRYDIKVHVRNIILHIICDSTLMYGGCIPYVRRQHGQC